MNQSVSVDAVCDRCGKTEFFRGETGSEARERAYAAGWRETSPPNQQFGLCPECREKSSRTPAG